MRVYQNRNQLLFCHPERSEGSRKQELMYTTSFALLRMTLLFDSRFFYLNIRISPNCLVGAYRIRPNTPTNSRGCFQGVCDTPLHGMFADIQLFYFDTPSLCKRMTLPHPHRLRAKLCNPLPVRNQNHRFAFYLPRQPFQQFLFRLAVKCRTRFIQQQDIPRT